MIDTILGINPLTSASVEAHERVDKQKRYTQIIEILKDYPNGLTAKEIAVEMYRRKEIPTTERNFSSPRLNELMKIGVVDCIGKKKCKYTDRTVCIFTLRKVCSICGNLIGDFDDNGIYGGEYCKECYEEAQESRLA